MRRFVAQSFASLRYAREGGPVKSEDDPLDPTPVAEDARDQRRDALSRRGGHGAPAGSRFATATSTAPPTTALIEPVRKRQFPIVGNGGGVSSFIHLDDAAAATVLALEQGGAGIYNVVDDEPAPVTRVAAGARGGARRQAAAPLPRWLARLFAGEAAVMIGTEARGASNAKAKRELGWKPRYPSWRQGFARRDYASTARADHRAASLAAAFD